MKYATFVIALLSLGCGAETDSGEPAHVEPEPLSEVCERDAERVEAAFARVDGSSLFRGVAPAPFAVRGTSIESPLPHLVVSAERIAIDDVDVRGATAADALAAEMSVRTSLAGAADPSDHAVPSADAVLLYVPSRTMVSHVRLATRALSPRLRFDLVVQQSTGATEEEANPPAWLDAELRAMQETPDMVARRERFRGLFTRASGQCPQARTHAPFLFGRDPSVPEQAAPEGTLSDALRECRCAGVDVDAMVAIGILTGPPNRHPLRRLSFVQVFEPADGAVEAEDGMSIDLLATALSEVEEPRRVRFVVPD